tara:strand:- start:53 stop:463 length:411 start_codon:yes stop_codon:yes gene_type:complete
MSALSKLRLTAFPNGLATFLVDNNAEIKTANYTVVITADSGKTLASTLDAIVYTLPSIAVGNTVTFVNMAEDGQAAINISPAAVDGITYAGTAVDNKDLINTKATAKKGDFVTLASLDGVVAWQVVDVRGVWAKEG